MPKTIKELKAGDDFIGKLNTVEIIVEDGVGTASWVETKGVQGNLEAVEQEIARLEADIAHRQSNLALFKSLQAALTK